MSREAPLFLGTQKAPRVAAEPSQRRQRNMPPASRRCKKRWYSTLPALSFASQNGCLIVLSARRASASPGSRSRLARQSRS
eukprot:875157-Lingulodinium_polyedra.AAC.1